MKIINMASLNQEQINQAAQILSDSLPLGWPSFEDALEEIKELLIPENTLLAAVENDTVTGWGGVLPDYGGNVFELHPLAVREDMRGKGLGLKLLSALEAAARDAGGFTMSVGADDEVEGGETSFANVDLYDGLPERLAGFKPGTHQSAFYIKNGYIVTGVLPDANGPGKPDIFLCKSLSNPKNIN